MQPKNFGGVNTERTIHKNRHRWQLPFARQLMQRIDDLLRATNGESRDDNASLVLQQRFLQQPLHLGFGISAARMLAPAVGAFNLEVINTLNRCWISENIVVTAANVAAEQIAELPI